MTKDEAMKLALKAMEDHGHAWARHEVQYSNAMIALREALAEQPAPPPECQTEAEKTAFAFGWFKALESVRQQPAQQEPVAWMIWTHGPVLVFMNKDEANMEFDRLNHAYPEPVRMLVPLYTSPQPAQTVNLDMVSGFTFSVEHGTFIGEVEMLKWLVENRSKDYWEHVAKEGKRK